MADNIKFPDGVQELPYEEIEYFLVNKKGNKNIAKVSSESLASGYAPQSDDEIFE